MTIPARGVDETRSPPPLLSSIVEPHDSVAVSS
jgi:hypothetical protein